MNSNAVILHCTLVYSSVGVSAGMSNPEHPPDRAARAYNQISYGGQLNTFDQHRIIRARLQGRHSLAAEAFPLSGVALVLTFCS
jgi:hypothetical protein